MAIAHEGRPRVRYLFQRQSLEIAVDSVYFGSRPPAFA